MVEDPVTAEPWRNGHLVRVVARKRVAERAFVAASWIVLASVFAALGVLIAGILVRGLPWLSTTFLTSPPSRFPEEAGILPALVGSLWLVGLTGLIAIPVGLLTAIYLSEYARNTRFTRFLILNVSNMSGIPAIVFGIFGLFLFVRALALGPSLLAGSLTMSLVILPIIVMAAFEALQAVPKSYREASLALGASRWQTTIRVVVPAALPGIAAGVLLALARALGEAAPLVTIGALAYVAYVPRHPNDPFTALPIQVFTWASRPQVEFQSIASAAIIVLLVLVFSLNLAALAVRGRALRHRGDRR